MAKIGVVTVTFNSGTVLDDFMQSMLKQNHHEWVLYVVDNDSKDNTLSFLAKYANNNIKLIANKENCGVAKGNNQGIELALADNCDYILLLNNDTVFDENLFKVLLDDLDINHADMITPKIMYFKPDNLIWCAGGELSKAQAFKAIHYGENEIDTGQYDQVKICEYVPTCCVLIKSELFKQVGFMDEKYFVYVDDVDWMFRAHKFGAKLVYTYKAVLFHKVSSLTGGRTSKFSAFYGTRNRVYFIRKNIKGLIKYFYITAYLFSMILGLIIRRISFTEFKWKLPAFFRGLFY